MKSKSGGVYVRRTKDMLIWSRYDIRNFCYVQHRPFHPRRLYELIHDKFILQHDEESDGEEADEDGKTAATE